MRKYKFKYPKKECKNKKLKRIIDKRVKKCKKHFKKDGFALDVDFIEEDIIEEYFGEHITEYLYGELCKIKGLYTEVSFIDMHSRRLVKKEDYFAVYYDFWENKFVVLEEGYDVMDYREFDGYEYLGCL